MGLVVGRLSLSVLVFSIAREVYEVKQNLPNKNVYYE